VSREKQLKKNILYKILIIVLLKFEAWSKEALSLKAYGRM